MMRFERFPGLLIFVILSGKIIMSGVNVFADSETNKGLETLTNDFGVWTYLWKMDNSKEMAGKFRSDNSGSKFTLDTNLFTHGKASVRISSPGNGVEARLKIRLSQDQIVLWSGKKKLLLYLYLPANCNLNQIFYYIHRDQPFAWVDGSMVSDFQPGWNEVVLFLTDKMAAIEPGKMYYFGLAFFNMEGGKKTAINTPINLGGLLISK